jgi:DNA-binding response OmpR family regulator
MNPRPSILVVDDDQSARDTVEALLHADGYDLSFAASGAEALDAVGARPVDVVLCDVMMPGMDGFEVCRRIKVHVEWRLIPIVLVTALDGQDDLVRGIESGADDFLSKPLERAVLRARVRAMLRVRALYEEARGNAPDLDTLLLGRRERVIDGAGLSQRERQVLDLLLLGRSHQEIASVLGISARTSKYHQANVLDKLGADSRVDLVRIFL